MQRSNAMFKTTILAEHTAQLSQINCATWNLVVMQMLWKVIQFIICRFAEYFVVTKIIAELITHWQRVTA